MALAAWETLESIFSPRVMQWRGHFIMNQRGREAVYGLQEVMEMVKGGGKNGLLH